MSSSAFCTYFLLHISTAPLAALRRRKTKHVEYLFQVSDPPLFEGWPQPPLWWSYAFSTTSLMTFIETPILTSGSAFKNTSLFHFSTGLLKSNAAGEALAF